MHLLWPVGPFSGCLSSSAKRQRSSVVVGVLVSKSNIPTDTLPRMQIQATLCHTQLSLPLLALLDSGAEQSFLDSNLVSQAGISVKPVDCPMKVNALMVNF